MKEVINEGLRRGLSGGPTGRRKRFRVQPHASAYQPGLDREKLGQLSDELEAEAFLSSRRARQRQ